MLTDDDVAALNDQACTNNFGRQGEWDELSEEGKDWARELARLAYERGLSERDEAMAVQVPGVKTFRVSERCQDCGAFKREHLGFVLACPPLPESRPVPEQRDVREPQGAPPGPPAPPDGWRGVGEHELAVRHRRNRGAPQKPEGG